MVFTDDLASLLCFTRFPRSANNSVFTHGLMAHSIGLFLIPASDKDHCMCYPVCGKMLIKDSFPLIGKSSPCGSSMFSLSLNGPLPYVRCHITVNKMC